ncbi:hypothetical protein [Hymenobacter negativus]|uniref:GNAT family N-acetyltransferase n=1 Tax=Hymenobacter negativus TaxID=2795026 RepID=A0ABS3QLQ4_9BACT|nr:hypothetical protein [Hymenobacter negativus]MBO2012192.1 hypothetical protein [Hymenobacter negativus]
MLIEIEKKQIEVEKIYDRLWEGIVFFAAQTNQYFFSDLGWCGGGYVERIKEITESDYRAFRELV